MPETNMTARAIVLAATADLRADLGRTQKQLAEVTARIDAYTYPCPALTRDGDLQWDLRARERTLCRLIDRKGQEALGRL